jgi:soluble lytic murein transglycosylase-like protein
MKKLIAKKVMLAVTEMTVKLFILVFCVIFLNTQFTEMSRVAVPVLVSQENSVDPTEVALLSLGAPRKEVKELTRAVRIASQATNFAEKLTVAVIYTESRFNRNAVSSAGYKGIAQTPTATFKYPAVDALHGMSILRDYYNATGNLEDALTLYKGGKLTNNTARGYARETIRIYENLVRRT